jgi:hypothetical protein
VFNLILLLLLLWFVLTVLLAAWALFFQGYIYTEPATGLEWRAPAAGSALMVPLLLWVFIDYHSPGNYRTLFDFSAIEEQKPYPELRVPTAAGGEQVYKLMPGNRLEYRRDGKAYRPQLPPRPEKIIVQEGDEKLVFERKAEGKRSRWNLNQTAEGVRYVARDSKGRRLVMEEDSIGQVTSFRTGRFIGNVLINFLFLAVWFVGLWLLLRFGWSIALLQAGVYWLAMTLFVMPPVLTRAEEVAKQRAAARQTSDRGSAEHRLALIGDGAPAAPAPRVGPPVCASAAPLPAPVPGRPLAAPPSSPAAGTT